MRHVCYQFALMGPFSLIKLFCSNKDGRSGESGDLDGLIASIRDVVITPETMRLFLPKVNWDQVAAMYIPGRSGAECQSR